MISLRDIPSLSRLNTLFHRSTLTKSVFALALLLGGLLFTAPVALAQTVTIVDDGGADDQTGQKDLSQLSVNYDGLPDTISLSWNWDDVDWSGGNTGDACSLYDTDGDGNANYSLCVQVGGSPATYQSTTLYSCDDSDADRCNGNTVISPIASTCNASVQINTDPFGVFGSPDYDSGHLTNNACKDTDECFTDDTVATCTVQRSDLSGASEIFLLNICTYPSEVPNSAASDCVISPNSGFLTIVKNAGSDTTTDFGFNIGSGQSAQNGETSWTITGSGTEALIPFAAGTAYDLSEVVPNDWTLTAASCSLSNGTVTGTSVTSGVENFTIQTGRATTCTFSNARDVGTLEIKKDVVPDDGNSQWDITVVGPTSFGQTLIGDGTTGARPVETGTYSVAETGNNVSLSDYFSSYSCTVNGQAGPADSGTSISNLTINKNDVVACTFTNTLKVASMAIAKTPDVQVIKPGESALFTIRITNTGNLPLTDVTVTDTLAPDCARSSTDLAGSLPLQPNDFIEYSCSLPNVQQGFLNTATADSAETDAVSDTARVEVAELEILKEKAIPSYSDADQSGSITLGDTLNYEITVTNSGSATLNNVTVTDPLLGGTLACSPGTPLNGFAPGAQIVCTGSYTVTQADVDRGGVENTATADSTESDPVQDSESFTVPQNPAIAIDKAFAGYVDSDGSTTISLNDTLNYTIVATNSGNVTLDNVTVSDPLLGNTLSCLPALPVNDLAPDGTITCTGSYVVQQGNVDAGKVDNTATAQGEDPDDLPVGPVTDDESVTIPRTFALAIDKQYAGYTDNDASSDISVGDTLNYTIVVTNTGNTTLENVTLTDSIIDDSDLSCTPDVPAVSLAPGATITCTGAYDVIQDDIDAGEVLNTAAADSDQTEPVEDGATVPIPRTFALDIDKQFEDYEDSDSSGTVSLDDTLNYSIVVTNIGNTTLNNVTVSDSIIAGLSCNPVLPVNGFAPGATINCSGAYLVTQSDVNAGQIDNTATADSNETEPVEDTVTVNVPQSFELTIDKRFVDYDDKDNSTDISLDDTLNYAIEVTNAGNTTLTNVTVNDSLINGLLCTPSVPVAALAPQATISCTGSYTVIQADVNRGLVDNTATASSVETGQVTDDALVPIGQTPALNVDKAFTNYVDNDGNGEVSLGDRLNYQITATNEGNVTLTNVTVSDPLLGTLVCTPAQPATLLPDAAIVCSGSYVVTQADVNAGERINTATADSNQTDPENDTERVIIPQEPRLETNKVLFSNADEDGSNTVSVDDTLTYRITVTNVGNITLSSVSVGDPMLPTLVCTPSQPATLAPAESIVCTGDYVVTQDDVDAGNIFNTATGDSAETDPDPDTETVPVPQAPGLDTEKRLIANADEDGSNSVSAGDTLTYRITVVNNGNVTLTNVTVSDPRLPALACTPNQPATLAPGQAIVCTGEYVVTQGDVDAGNIFNTATGDSDETNPDPDTETVPVPQAPELNVVKRLAGNDDADDSGNVSLGDTLTYQIVVTNEGNVTLTDVTLSDPLLPALTCSPAQPATLAPGEAMVCTGTYLVTQSDVDAGVILNTATGDSEQTDPDRDTETVAVPQNPDILLIKVMVQLDDADSSNSPTLGDTLNYELTATNTGNVTLDNVTITDPLLGTLACTPAQPATLAPGTAMICTGAHVITQTDVDAGRVLNIATAAGEFLEDQEVTDTDTVNTPVQDPTAISLSSFGAITVGETVEIHWSTALELNTWGYYIYRGNNPDFATTTRITESMIIGKGDSGGDYVYVDADVVMGQTYYYWLVEIQGGTVATPHGPLRVTVGDTGSQRLFLPLVEQ